MLPNYLKLLKTGELEARVVALEKLLESCTICPKDCGNNRLADEIAACYSGKLPIVSSHTAHFGEEPALSGTHGAGNIFFGNCNLRCVYCQNYQISQTWKTQKKNEISHERLAEMMLDQPCKELQLGDGSNVLFFLSSLGSLPSMELFTLSGAIQKALSAMGVAIGRSLVGNFMSSLDTYGASMTLMKLDDELLQLFDSPVMTPALRWGV